MHAWFGDHGRPCKRAKSSHLYGTMHPSTSVSRSTAHIHPRVHLLWTIHCHTHAHTLLGTLVYHRGCINHYWQSHAWLLGHHTILLCCVHLHARHVGASWWVLKLSMTHKVHRLLLLGLYGIHM